MPSKTEQGITGFYDGIYLFYESANSFLTLGLDGRWRRAAARAAFAAVPGAADVLDVCCGTGDLSAALLKARKDVRLTGADLNEAMLSLAAKKLPGAKLVRAEAKKLPFPDGSFDLVTMAFAARNLNIDRAKMLEALREFRRVLRPGGAFVNLETSVPRAPLLRLPMTLYVKAAIGLLNLISPRSRDSYSFLRDTILSFYPADDFSSLLREAGFSAASYLRLFPGPVAVHTAKK
ncbi:MAG: class I SAM-dependent methyltransferase [Elusimicrobia bacterium]|nr:class I SAM-dependent methyltransferase [Elusimicrobiota bacterium]